MGGGRKAGSSSFVTTLVCKIAPSATRGRSRPAGVKKMAFGSDPRIQLFRGERLAPYRNPNLVARLVECIGCEKLLTRNGSVEVDFKLIDDLSRPGRHHTDAIREINRLADVMRDHQNRLSRLKPNPE